MTTENESREETEQEIAQRLHDSLNTHFPLATHLGSTFRSDSVEMQADGYSPYWTISHSGVKQEKPDSTDKFWITIPVKGRLNFVWIEYGIDPNNPEQPLYRQGPEDLQAWETFSGTPIALPNVIEKIVNRIIDPSSN